MGSVEQGDWSFSSELLKWLALRADRELLEFGCTVSFQVLSDLSWSWSCRHS